MGCDNNQNDPEEPNKEQEEKKDFASGTGTEADPFVIEEGYQWVNISKDLDAYYVLGKDISLASLENFEPIGNEQTPFKGNVDGKRKTSSRTC